MRLSQLNIEDLVGRSASTVKMYLYSGILYKSCDSNQGKFVLSKTDKQQ